MSECPMSFCCTVCRDDPILCPSNVNKRFLSCPTYNKVISNFVCIEKEEKIERIRSEFDLDGYD